MTRATQKKTERTILEAYLNARRVSVAMIRPGPEPPDFMIERGQELIGVEVTEYHDLLPTASGHPRRVVEATWDALREVVTQYRESHMGLDRLSVILDFHSLKLPPSKKHLTFVRAAAAVISMNGKHISENDFAIAITTEHQAILYEYLRCITVRRIGCYMEWDWNHMFARIGTEERDLLASIGPKLTYQALPQAAVNWLIVAGGWRHSELIAVRSLEHLNNFARLNRMLQAGPFDEIALLGNRWFIWARRSGWSKLADKRSC
ncbi:MAG: hypothetical protein HY246_06490 [Proteobacteria bacterium]|nr:hypothetical protein [Pseudomonadota bacterium]